MHPHPLFRHESPIVIHDDDDAHGLQRLHHRDEHIDLTGDDEEDDNQEVLDEVGAIIDLTGDEVGAIIDLTGDEPPRTQQRVFWPLAQPNLAYPFNGRHPIQHNGFPVKIGSCVEIKCIEENFRVQFLKVTAITHSPHGGCVVHGLPFTRTRHLDGRLPRKINEVCMIVESTHGDPRSEDQQSTIAVALQDIIKPRDLVCTNANYPTYKYKLPRRVSLQDGYDNGRLVCRWKYQRIWQNAQARRRKPPSEYAFLRMGPKEVTAGYCKDEMGRFNTWRAGRVVPEHVMAPQQPSGWDIQPGGHHRYSFGDFFAGAGGASCGARDAHLKVRAACEFDNAAGDTYKANFPETRLYKTDIHYFINPYDQHGSLRLNINHDRLDIIHLSPPCQPFSVAHSTPGRNDEMNQAALFSCWPVVKKERPRIFTLEEAYGIMSVTKHQDFFNQLIRGFIDLSCSVRWKIVDLRDWGVPMRRLRLIMIGSCPGEPLPEFPANSHSEHGFDNLRRWSTVNEALRTIPNNRARQVDSHDIAGARHFDILKAPWNPNIPLPRTIITAGSRDYHPLGHREFTVRELATICGFPVRHRFTGSNADRKRQVGNCFPSVAAKHLFSHIRESMKQTDQVRRVVEALDIMDVSDAEEEHDIIDISDDEEGQDIIMID